MVKLPAMGSVVGLFARTTRNSAHVRPYLIIPGLLRPRVKLFFLVSSLLRVRQPWYKLIIISILPLIHTSERKSSFCKVIAFKDKKSRNRNSQLSREVSVW